MSKKTLLPFVELSSFPFKREHTPTCYRVVFHEGEVLPPLDELRIAAELDGKPDLLPHQNGVPYTGWSEPFLESWAPVMPARSKEAQALTYVEQVGEYLVWRRRSWKKKLIPSAVMAAVDLRLRHGPPGGLRSIIQEQVEAEMRAKVQPSIKDEIVAYNVRQSRLYLFTNSPSEVDRLTKAWQSSLKVCTQPARCELFEVSYWSWLDMHIPLHGDSARDSYRLCDALGRAANTERELWLVEPPEEEGGEPFRRKIGVLQLAREATLWQSGDKHARIKLTGEGTGATMNALLKPLPGLDAELQEDDLEKKPARHLTQLDLVLGSPEDPERPMLAYRLGASRPARIEGDKPSLDLGQEADAIWSDRFHAAIWEVESGYDLYLGMMEAVIRATMPHLNIQPNVNGWTVGYELNAGPSLDPTDDGEVFDTSTG